MHPSILLLAILAKRCWPGLARSPRGRLLLESSSETAHRAGRCAARHSSRKSARRMLCPFPLHRMLLPLQMYSTVLPATGQRRNSSCLPCIRSCHSSGRITFIIAARPQQSHAAQPSAIHPPHALSSASSISGIRIRIRRSGRAGPAAAAVHEPPRAGAGAGALPTAGGRPPAGHCPRSNTGGWRYCGPCRPVGWPILFLFLFPFPSPALQWPLG